jgi:hypothetical protein
VALHHPRPLPGDRDHRHYHWSISRPLQPKQLRFPVLRQSAQRLAMSHHLGHRRRRYVAPKPGPRGLGVLLVLRRFCICFMFRLMPVTMSHSHAMLPGRPGLLDASRKGLGDEVTRVTSLPGPPGGTAPRSLFPPPFREKKKERTSEVPLLSSLSSPSAPPASFRASRDDER